MFREAIYNLEKWKNKASRKPLIVKGARQVGKTWLMKEFAKDYFEDYVYINFENNSLMADLFSADYEVDRLLQGIELFAGKEIDLDNTLIIFDEIQEVPRAITSLKYFDEDGRNKNIICAGSLLGISLHDGISFPVGKVEFLDLYPLSFNEFLMAMDKKKYTNLISKNDFNMLNIFSQDLTELLKQYYYVGGMPEAVSDFVKNRDYLNVREIQERILFGYERDFSKHAPSRIVPRIRALFNSVLAQLSKENKKFIYGLVKSGARAREYELALMWMIDYGLVYKVNRVNNHGIPLSMYADEKAFKLYLLDVGLLSCMAKLEPSVILDKNDLFKEFKGALTEQFVLGELVKVSNSSIYYWTNDGGTAEVDFVIQYANKIIPIEVKAEINLKAKSLKIYREKYKPEILVRTSMANYKEEDWLINLPLWAVKNVGSL